MDKEYDNLSYNKKLNDYPGYFTSWESLRSERSALHPVLIFKHLDFL